MYDAKEAGRDQYVVLDDSEHDAAAHGRPDGVVGADPAAIENDEFVLHLQPILDVAPAGSPAPRP